MERTMVYIDISNNRDVNEKDKYGNISLNDAAMHGYLECMKFLISNGSNVNEKDDGCTPLHTTIIYGHLDFVKFLISNGANVNEKDKYGRTPLQLFRKAK